MRIFSCIVAPTDLGEGSVASVHVAASIAADYGIPLCVMHVYALPAAVFGVYPMVTALMASLPVQEAAEHALRDWTARLALDIVPELVVRGGAVTETVLDEVATRNADLIVIGTHVHRGLASAVIGGTAQKLIRAAPVPVLTVRPETTIRQRARQTSLLG